MADCNGTCGITIHCSGGCGVFCTTDCKDCTQWCEPTTLPATGDSPAVMVRTTRAGGGKDARTVTRVGREAEAPSAELEKYPDSQELRFCFNDMSRASLAHVLGSMCTRTVRAPRDKGAETLSGSGTATVAELAEKYGLQLG